MKKSSTEAILRIIDPANIGSRMILKPNQHINPEEETELDFSGTLSPPFLSISSHTTNESINTGATSSLGKRSFSHIDDCEADVDETVNKLKNEPSDYDQIVDLELLTEDISNLTFSPTLKKQATEIEVEFQMKSTVVKYKY